MALHHAVLALLADGPCHGYELKFAFERSAGPQWGKLNVGQLYQVLGRLAADGLITSEREPQTARPDRLVHALTPRGRAALDEWLQEPTIRQHGYRDDFFLKLMAAARTGRPSAIHELIGRQRDYLIGELHNLVTLARQPAPDTVSLLLVDAAQLHLQADIKLLDRVEEQAHALAEAGRASATASGTAAASEAGRRSQRRAG